MEVRIGQKWRSDLGGYPVVVVGFEKDTGWALVKRADSPKKSLAHTRGAYPTPLSEFWAWTLLEDAAPCFAEHCILPNGHKPQPHRAKNGYEWASMTPTTEQGS